MNRVLQDILIVGSIIFFIFIVNMIRNKKLELTHALTWMMTSLGFIILSLFPGITKGMAQLLHIKEPVNAVFMSIIFFLLFIVFTLTLFISRNADRVKTLTQEVGLLKLEIERIKRKMESNEMD